MSKAIIIKDTTQLVAGGTECHQAGDVITWEGQPSYHTIMLMHLGNAVEVPVMGPVKMSRQVFEYLLVRAGVLPEPFMVPFPLTGHPLNAALRGGINA